MSDSIIGSPFYTQELSTLYCGDSLQVLKDFPDDSVDLLATDPPYGAAFMGKAWDKAVPSVEIWRECLRVLKPGAFAFVMSLPRQDCLARMIVNLQDAGFETGYSSLYHTFASGFPKSMSISKAADKRLGAEREVVGKIKGMGKQNPEWNGTAQGRAENSFKPEYNATIPATPQAQALDGSYSGFSPKPALEAILICMKPLGYIDRKFFWERDKYDYFYTSRTEIDTETEAGRKQKENLEQKYGQLLQDGDVIEDRIAINPDNLDETILNRGIVLKSKPYQNTDLSGFASQAMKNGKGITWLDDCRIGTSGGTKRSHQADFQRGGQPGAVHATRGYRTGHDILPINQGRFMANLLVSDDVLNDGKMRKSSPVGHKGVGWKHSGNTKDEMTPLRYQQEFNDSGSFSRYFSLDVWWEERIKSLPESVRQTFPFLVVPKASRGEKEKGLENFPEQKCRGDYNDSSQFGLLEKIQNSPRPTAKNNHPTVKPLKLFAFLVTLGSRKGDVVLDPFAGTGTTLLAASMLGRKSIGIELDESYCNIAKARMGGTYDVGEAEEPIEDEMSEGQIELPF